MGLMLSTIPTLQHTQTCVTAYALCYIFPAQSHQSIKESTDHSRLRLPSFVLPGMINSLLAGDAVGLRIKGLTVKNMPRIGDCVVLSRDADALRMTDAFTAHVQVTGKSVQTDHLAVVRWLRLVWDYDGVVLLRCGKA